MNPYLDKTLGLNRGTNRPVVMPNPSMTFASGPDGYLHFSIPTTIAEEAAWWALGEEHAVPAQISVSLLRPARVGDGPIEGKGEVIRRGRGIMTSQGTAYQAGKPIAVVVVTWTRFEKSNASAAVAA